MTEEKLTLDGATLLLVIEEAKEQARQEIRLEIEQQIRDEYAKAPVYRGVFGFLSRVVGLAPDSSGKPSGSWTLYILSHLPVVIITVAWVIALLMKIDLKNITNPSPWIVLTPMVLSWVAWLAHHKKLAEVAVLVLEALGKAFAGISGKGVAVSVAQTATAVVADMKAPDPALKPGEKVVLSPKTDGSSPKTDPATVPAPPPSI
jgi:hypothetical protein